MSEKIWGNFLNKSVTSGKIKKINKNCGEYNMSKIIITKDRIEISLTLKLCVTEEEYAIELNDTACNQSITLQEMKKDDFKIEDALKRYNEIKNSIIKEKYKDIKKFYIKKCAITNRKVLYLKSDKLHYEIGYKVEKDVAIGMSIAEEQVIERESKFDMGLDTALSRYNELKVKLCDGK